MSSVMLEKNISLKEYNTFGLDAKAESFVTLLTQQDILNLLNDTIYQKGPVLWLGGGSNIIFQADVPGVVAKIALKGIEVVRENDSDILVDVEAGEVWHDWVQYAIDKNWYGIENLSLIPGTVGAAPVQNIGAYGVEVKDVIDSVLCINTKTGEYKRFSNEECQFAYRNSIFKQECKGLYVITTVRFRLSKVLKANIGYGDLQKIINPLLKNELLSARIIAQAVISLRQQKLPDPKVLGNAGSFFHNPIVDKEFSKVLLEEYPDLPHYPYGDKKEKLAAGWLIDKAGLKGYQVGQAAVHVSQALVLVNKSQATAQDVLDLCHHIQKTVEEKFGIFLHPEPSFIPEF